MTLEELEAEARKLDSSERAELIRRLSAGSEDSAPRCGAFSSPWTCCVVTWKPHRRSPRRPPCLDQRDDERERLWLQDAMRRSRELRAAQPPPAERGKAVSPASPGAKPGTMRALSTGPVRPRRPSRRGAPRRTRCAPRPRRSAPRSRRRSHSRNRSRAPGPLPRGPRARSRVRDRPGRRRGRGPGRNPAARTVRPSEIPEPAGGHRIRLKKLGDSHWNKP